jgi:hypothetical protein
VREEMPPFAGSEDERRAIAQHLAALAATVPGDGAPAADDTPKEDEP